MAERLKASGATTEVLVVPGGERLFNFRQPQQATQAWQATLAWLDRYLHPTPRPGWLKIKNLDYSQARDRHELFERA